MKHLRFAAFAAALLCFQLNSSAQTASEPEEEGNGVTISIIPRIEGNWQNYKTDVRQNAFGLGNSGLSTELDGSFTDNLAIYGLFVLADSDPVSLYANSLRPDECTWVRMFNLTYSLGNFDITLGKDALAFGGFEKDENEYNGYLDCYSTSWHLIQPYLWGGRLSYNLNDDNAVFFQALNSPFVLNEDKPLAFQNGLMTFSLGWNGYMTENWETMWSVTHMQTGDDANYKMLSLGNRWTAGDWQITLDLEARAQGAATIFNNEMTTVGQIRHIGDKFETFFKGGWEFCHQTECNYFAYGEDKYIEGLIVPNLLTPSKDYLFGALGFEYFPLADHSLRIHTVGAANNFGGFSITAGLTYFLDFDLF